MKKTYWWRIGLGIVCVLILAVTFFGPCDQKFGRCAGGDDIIIVRTLFHFFLATIIVTPLLFFVKDNIFLKWLKFAIAWFILEILCIALSPAYSGDFLGLIPEKELVSTWMSELFVIISICIIAYQSYKLRKK